MTEATAPLQFPSKVSRSSNRPDLHAVQRSVQEALHRTGYGELRQLNLECEGDAVTITGRVPTYYLKQLVQCIAADAPGVAQINNKVHVC